MIFSRTFQVDDSYQVLVQKDLTRDHQRFSFFQQERDLVWQTVIGSYKMEHISTYDNAQMRDRAFELIDGEDAREVFNYLSHHQRLQEAEDNAARYN